MISFSRKWNALQNYWTRTLRNVHEQDPTMQTSVVCKTRNKGLFLESPRSFLGLESYFVFAVFTFKIKASSILTMTQWNYQLTKAKLTVCEPGTVLLLILKLAFGPEKFPGFSRNGPQDWNTPTILSQDTLAHPETPPTDRIPRRTPWPFITKNRKKTT